MARFSRLVKPASQEFVRLEVLRTELAPRQVGVTVVHPGGVRTDIARSPPARSQTSESAPIGSSISTVAGMVWPGSAWGWITRCSGRRPRIALDRVPTAPPS